MLLPIESSHIEQTAGQKLMLAFQGKEELPGEAREAIRKYRPAGFTLFRAFNIESPEHVYRLTQALQQEARVQGLPPFLIAADQEGGQLMAIGEGTTPLPGNMALGAAGSADLARRAGEVLGCELSAMGININYAPSCDVNINPQNPVIGTRSFGEDPQSVAGLAAEMAAGIQSEGVAGTAKHFPGHGDTASDSHDGIPSVPHDLERLWQVELPPFQATIRAGVRLVMTAHLALPAVTGREDLASTLSQAVLKGLLRNELGFDGVVVSDALDMKAIQQGEGLGEEAARAVEAGCDLLLLTADPADHERVYHGVLEAIQSGRLDSDDVLASAQRVHALKEWLAARPAPPDLSVVGCASHREIAAEIAAKSVTLVRDRTRSLPLRLGGGQRLAVILPQPADLTPADTSSYVAHSLAQALRRYHPQVDEFILPHSPQDGDIAAVLEQIRECQAVVLGTINAFSTLGQAALVNAVLRTGIQTICVALRMPYDLATFPEASTYLCTYSVLEPSMHALARVLFGEAYACGRLPVSIPGIYPRGHREER
jgi:beta-N-acetylhexosaminidase